MKIKNNLKLKNLKRKILVLLVLIMFIVQISIINTQEDDEDKIIDYGKQIGWKEGELVGYGVKVKKYYKFNDVIFSSEDPYVVIKGEKFENIKFNPKGFRYIRLDNSGKIISAEFQVNEKGGIYNIEGTEFHAPPNSRVVFDGKKIMVKALDNSEIEQLPKSSNGKGPVVEYSGKNIKINENIFDGKLSFRADGQMFVSVESLKEPIKINNIKVWYLDEASYTKISKPKDFNLFFDGEEHEGNYISFGEKNLIVNSEDSNILVTFLENNNYLKIDPEDYVFMETGVFSQINIQKRDEEGLIPKVITKGENIYINQDAYILKTVNGDVRIKNSPTAYVSTTSPIELLMLDENGKELLGKFLDGEEIKGHKIFVDNFNRIAVVPKDAEETVASFEGIDVKFSRRIGYNYITQSEEEIRVLTGKKVSFDKDVSEGIEEMILVKLRDYWQTLTPETKEVIEELKFFRHAQAYAGLAYEQERKIIFSSHAFDLRTFSHESAHLKHFSLKESSFDKEWDEIGRGPYITDYAKNDIYEHVAETVKVAIAEPNFFADLINPKSEKYNVRYRKQLDLLYKYKFISDKQYNKVLEFAGLKMILAVLK